MIDENEKEDELQEEKEEEIIFKDKDGDGREVNIDLGDYRAFLSFALLGITAYFAYLGNEAWREFALMSGMALAWWFKRDGK
ncbi:MAG: hypothetical protein QXU32_11885 [Nitrososphaerales archaeon]